MNQPYRASLTFPLMKLFESRGAKLIHNGLDSNNQETDSNHQTIPVVEPPLDV